MYASTNIHHKTLNDCLDLGTIYLGNLFLSLDLLETTKTCLLTLDEIKSLIIAKRKLHKIKHPAAKGILAEFKNDASKNLEFYSLNGLAIHLKGDRQVIRDYLKGNKPGYYRGKWKFTYKNLDIWTFNIKIIDLFYEAWPGKAEMFYFLFTICWNPFRAIRTSNTDFFFEKRYDTVTF